MSHAIASSPVKESGPATETWKTAASPMLRTGGAWLAGGGRSPARTLDVQPAIVRVPASALPAMRSDPRIAASCTRVGQRQPPELRWSRPAGQAPASCARLSIAQCSDTLNRCHTRFPGNPNGKNPICCELVGHTALRRLLSDW